jgi:ABC-2 type transport system permease protein
MKSDFLILLKKQLKESFSFSKKGRKSFDYLGFFTSLILVAIVVWVFILIYATFVKTYTNISLNGDEMLERQFEILTISYSLLLLFNVLSGIRNINVSIASNEDLEILLVLPIKPQIIFLSKLSGIFLSQILTSFLIILPLNLTFGIITIQSAWYVLVSILMCFVIPLISMIIASFLSMPYHYLSKFLKSKYILLTIIFTAGIALFFFLYSRVLSVFEQLLQTGAIKFVFNTKRIIQIKTLTKYLYPGNLFARLLLKKNLAVGFLSIFFIILVFGSLAYYLIKRMFTRVTQGKLENGKFVYKKTQRYKEHNSFISLLKKEFINVIRTPNYAFQYFAVTLSLPLMVYTSISLTSSFVNSALGINCNFELSIFILTMFSVLTNTFCATNISRDGNMFLMLKTMPIGYKQIIYSKVCFSSIVSIGSILITGIVLLVSRYLNWWEGLTVISITILISFSEIFFATKKDLNRPHFPINSKNEITESNNTVSLMIFLGLIISIIIGAVTLFSKILTAFSSKSLISFGLSVGIVSIFAVILFFTSLIYLRSGLKKKYYQMEE